MHFTIDNIGIVRNTSIRLDGITVIAGPNNTGKSTIGKTLWALASSRYDAAARADEARSEDLAAILSSRLSASGRQMPGMRSYGYSYAYELAGEAVDDLGIDATAETIREWLTAHDLATIDQLGKQGLDPSEEMAAVLDHSNDEYRTRFARRAFSSAFGGEIVSLLPGTHGKASVSLIDRRGEATIRFENGICVASEGQLDLDYCAFLINSPDSVLQSFQPRTRGFFDPTRVATLEVLQNEIVERRMAQTERKPNMPSSLSGSLLDNLDAIYPGRLEWNKTLGWLIKEERTLEADLPAETASRGALAMIWLRMLLEHRMLDSSVILILDEPEIHLHPEWQLEYAHLVIRMAKELGVRIVVTTHSPYFFQALRIFSDEEDMSGDVAFYGPTTMEDGSVRFDELNRAGYLSLVDTMARPFDHLTEVEIRNMATGKGEIMVDDVDNEENIDSDNIELDREETQ